MSDRKKIWLASPTMHGDEQKFVAEAFASNWVAPLGPNVNAFEQEMGAYIEGRHAAALDSGTAALHLAVKLLGIKEGDVVLCQALTFAASCNPVAYEKATPVFIDSEPDTWNMSPAALEEAFKKYPQAKAVIVVHLYGTPAKMDEIMAICNAHGVPLIEDAAEGCGSTYKGRKCGAFGHFGALSFNGNKLITTSGGGMLFSDSEEEIRMARNLSTQARDPLPYYSHSNIGYNYRMSNITAGIGRGQLLHIGEHLEKKNAIYAQYKKAFEDIDVISMNPMNKDGYANNWLSCMTIDPSCSVKPEDVMNALAQENIETRPIWNPMQNQPVFENCDFVTDPDADTFGDASVSDHIFKTGLCLPSDIKNTPEDMELIISTIRNLF